MKNIIGSVMVLNIVLTALCLVMTGVLLNPLSKLRNKAEDAMNGEAFAEEKHREKTYLNELDLINAYFAEMSETVEQNMEEISRLRESNKIYFSDYILDSLGKQSIAQINFRENVTETFYVISVRLPEYYDDFENFKKLVEDLLVQLKLYQGFIGEVYGNHILLCSKNPDFENVMYFFGRENQDIQAVFDRTPVQISVVGAEDKYAFSVTLIEKDRQNELEEYHNLVKAPLVATGRAVRDAHSTSLCCVGSLKKEYIYEINGDNRSRKKLVRRLMQEAIDLYASRHFSQARFLFARVLMKNSGNAAAAYYIRSIEEIKEGM
jgi:hypothetical protein